MPEGEKITPPKIAEDSPQVKEAGFRSVFAKLRKRRIIKTLAAFIGGGGEKYDGKICLPEVCANLCFGGAKKNRLFMTASQSLYAVYVEAQGV
jgi:hypothetical protein